MVAVIFSVFPFFCFFCYLCLLYITFVFLRNAFFYISYFLSFVLAVDLYIPVRGYNFFQ